ncbi:MAG: YfhO family protein [Acidimicrobiia bacterium]|nr:YfhO family protein [Acidimicrobiia bacterium]
MQLVLLVFLAALGYAACLAFGTVVAVRPAERGRTLVTEGVRLVLVAAAGLGVGAVTLLPTAAALGESARERVPYDDYASHWSVSETALLARTFWPSATPVGAEQMNDEMAFAGTATGVLALVGAVQRRRGAGLGRGILLAVALVTLGTPASWVAYHLVPGLDRLFPLGRALFLWCFAVALLAGLGLDAVIGRLRVWGAVALRMPSGTLADGRRTRRALRAGGAVVILAVVGGSAVQLVWYGRRVNPRSSPGTRHCSSPTTPVLDALSREATRIAEAGDRQRVVPVSGILPASIPMVFGIESAGGYESMMPRRVEAVWRVVAGSSPRQVLAEPSRGAYRSFYPAGVLRFGLLERLGVTTVLAVNEVPADPGWVANRPAPEATLRERYAGLDGRVDDLATGGPSRAWVVHEVEVVAGPEAALERFAETDFPFRDRMILEGDRPVVPAERGRPGAPATVTVAPLELNSARFTVESDEPGWLLMADTWAPGWSARVNGEPAPVLRADYVLRAVEIPAGASEVVLRYRPPGFVTGLWISTVTVLTVAVALVTSWWRGRRSLA